MLRVISFTSCPSIPGAISRESFAGWALGFIHAVGGDGEAAIAACRRSLDASPEPTSTALALSHFGYAYLELGDATRAIAVLEQAVEQLGRLLMPKSVGRVRAWLAEAYLRAGDLERALGAMIRSAKWRERAWGRRPALRRSSDAARSAGCRRSCSRARPRECRAARPS